MRNPVAASTVKHVTNQLNDFLLKNERAVTDIKEEVVKYVHRGQEERGAEDQQYKFGDFTRGFVANMVSRSREGLEETDSILKNLQAQTSSLFTAPSSQNARGASSEQQHPEPCCDDDDADDWEVATSPDAPIPKLAQSDGGLHIPTDATVEHVSCGATAETVAFTPDQRLLDEATAAEMNAPDAGVLPCADSGTFEQDVDTLTSQEANGSSKAVLFTEAVDRGNKAIADVVDRGRQTVELSNKAITEAVDRGRQAIDQGTESLKSNLPELDSTVLVAAVDRGKDAMNTAVCRVKAAADRANCSMVASQHHSEEHTEMTFVG